MPRYYIDVRSSFGTNEDMDGIEVSDVSAAMPKLWKWLISCGNAGLRYRQRLSVTSSSSSWMRVFVQS